MSYETRKALGARIARRANATSWSLDDWIAFGERRYGHGYREAAVATGLDYQTLRNYGVVARRFELSRRRDNLSFQPHAEVCALTAQSRIAGSIWQRPVAGQGGKLREQIRAARGEGRGSCHVLPLTVDAAHEQRWLAAAASLECPFEEWVLPLARRGRVGGTGRRPARPLTDPGGPVSRGSSPRVMRLWDVGSS